MGLRVKAKAISDEQKYSGYYAHVRRRPGDEFEIESEEQYSYFWMEPIGWEPKPIDPTQITKRQEAYARKLAALASGADSAAVMRAEDVRYARERVTLSRGESRRAQ